MIPRFFVDEPCEPGREVHLDSADARHAHIVLRLRAGDPLIVVRDGTAWDAALTGVRATEARVRIASARDEAGGELPAAVTVMQALTKGAKFDFVVEKAVELGARTIVPVQCARSHTDASEHKVERWRRIARAAASQARRRYIPIITEPLAWASALGRWSSTPPPIVAYERAPAGTLEEALAQACPAPNVAVAIGPEGGLTDAEVEAARGAGCALVSLGPTILRTETAALAMLAALAARCNWW
jgi:16S rRNA (uracil1498-N3)-methyltransferase